MKWKYLLLGALAIIVILTAGFLYQDYREKLAVEKLLAHMTETVERDTFYEGIYLDDIHLGGMTMEEASALFQKKAEERLNNLRVEFTYENQSWVFTHEDIQAGIDWEDKLNQLYLLAREGDLTDRYEEVERIRENHVKEETLLSCDFELIRDEINAIADSFYIKPQDADLQFLPDKSEKFKLIPHKDGQIVGAGLLFQQAMQAFVSEKPAVISIEPMPIEAKVKTAHLENATSLITRFTTSMAGSTENRKHNIALALSKVNGTKLGPGEIFSWLDVVGTVSSKTGYKPAPVIKPDKSLQDGIGGGICQASSTLFNSAAMAGMEIVERYHHSFPISYLDPGLDATVSSYVNFRFKNPRNTPVFIRAYRSGDKAVVEFYGEPLSNNGEYKLTTKLIEKIPAPEPKRVLDKKGEYVTEPGGEHVHVKSREGLRINTYRVLYENGKKVSSELLVKNYYKPIEGIIYYREGSTAPKPTTSPKPSQTPKPSQSPTTKPSESPDPEESQKPSPSSEPSESPKPTDNGE